MKQVDAAKKYGLSQSTIATFLKKRKQIEEIVNSNEINPQRKTTENTEECVWSLQKSLTQLEEKSGKMSGINVEKYLTADDLMVFAGVTEKDILSEITEEMENDDEEDDDDDTDPS
ncbi:hypothetical protein AVEN_120327-1 [Araneus ventricosus]|uniref:HTH psq-type domain-containing protein n=1 Tax=Araneus ventricosus TaxID=182803 RepID=A0A4Y2MKW0_ARAVE|nr:hypothetical protein AVEN_120327-1 [Araneus ventricosus]